MESLTKLQLKNKTERIVGIDFYSTPQIRVSGLIKESPNDFIVCEVTPDHTVLDVKKVETPKLNYNDSPIPSKKHKITSFELVKKNEDTILVAQRIARKLEIPLNFITWAGLKDNRALTVQKMTIKGDIRQKLSEIKNKNYFIKNIELVRKAVRIGGLWGNKFEIIIREINLENSQNLMSDSTTGEIEQVLNQIKEQIDIFGFPNFYGLQRFGSHRPNSHKIGKFLFQEEYKRAVEEFLFTTYPLESDYVKICRKELKNSLDFAAALTKFPPGLFYELRMIRNLVRKPDNYKDALKSLPKSLLNLLYSSFQSYLFNLAISTRIKSGASLNKAEKKDKISILYDQRGLHSPIVVKYRKSLKNHLDKLINMERATILCPVVGFNTNLSDSYFGAIYKKLLKKEKFDKNCFQNSKLSSLRYMGTDRPIFVKPKSFSLNYIKSSTKNKNPHIRLNFMLPKGTYATMLIREFLK